MSSAHILDSLWIAYGDQLGLEEWVVDVPRSQEGDRESNHNIFIRCFQRVWVVTADFSKYNSDGNSLC
jgi:hypothetical protein